jgi:hypothetical protein
MLCVPKKEILGRLTLMTNRVLFNLLHMNGPRAPLFECAARPRILLFNQGLVK